MTTLIGAVLFTGFLVAHAFVVTALVITAWGTSSGRSLAFRVGWTLYWLIYGGAGIAAALVGLLG